MGDQQVKIELCEADVDGDLRQSIHNVHQELWVRVLSPEPLGPGAWNDKALDLKGKLPAWATEKYQTVPCGFECDIWDDDDPEHDLYGFEQYWFLPIRGAVA